jgi:hypothetical protein
MRESHTLPQYPMLKLHYHIGQTIVFTACSIAVVGCDSLERITPRNSDNLREMDPIPGFATNDDPTSEVDVLRRRLFDSYVDYWPLISSEDQHERLPRVLVDPIPELRAFGVERVAVLLRDGEAVEEELQLVVTLVQDPHPTVRLAAAKLLPEINVEDLSDHIKRSDGKPIGLSEFVALALETEERQSVAALELAFFQSRPHRHAVNPTISRLRSGPVDHAAKTLFALLNANMVSDDQKNRIFKHVQRCLRIRSISKLPSLITLNAMLGDTTVQHGLIHLLKSPDKSMAMAVAQGFASSGFAEPLIELDDPDLYAFALVALRNRGGIDSIQDLMALDSEDNSDWDAAVFAIAIKLDITSLIRADDMLKRRDMSALRLSILQSFWQSLWDDSSTKSRPERVAIAKRAAPLLIETGDAVGALQLLGAFGDDLGDDDLLTLRFDAAIAASAWDAAADTRTVPEPWIEAWKLKANEPTTADAIRNQIILRFQDKLTASERELLGIVHVDASPDQNQ